MKYFLLYLVVEILQFVHEISSFREVLYKRGDLKNFSRFTYKHKKQSPGGVLSEDVLKNFAKFTEKCLCWSLFFNKVAGLKPETDRSSHWRCSVKRGVLKKGHTGVSEPAVHRSSTQNRCFWIIHKIHRKKPVLKSFFKVFFIVLGPCNVIKEDSSTGAFLLNFQNFLEHLYFEEHLWTSVSKLFLKRDSNTGVLLWILWIIQEHLFCKGSTNGWF